MKKYGFCPKCCLMNFLTKHHVYPKRFFKSKNPAFVYLCRDCHDELEKLIPYRKKLSKRMYEEILKSFIAGKNPIVRVDKTYPHHTLPTHNVGISMSA